MRLGSKAVPNWQLVTSERCDPWWNMALDESLLMTSLDDAPRCKVRVYGWDRSALTVGAHLKVDRSTLSRCEQEGICLVRRPTGGGAVLHSDDITYSVVAPILSGGVLESYRWVAQALICGLNNLGIEARVVEHGVRADALACFAKPTGADLQVGGRKICGSAQLRRNGWFLQHGSIPLTDNRPQSHRLLGTASLEDDSTCVSGFHTGTWKEVAEALMQGFRDVWGQEGETRPPTPGEDEKARSLVATKYSALLTL